MFAVIAVLTVRKRASSPDNPRLSPFTLLGIAAIGIIVAILFRPSKIRGVTAAPDLQTSSGMSSQQVSGLFILAGGIFITLWAYGIVAPSQRERLDPAVVQRLKWLGPLTLVLGLCEFLFHVRS
jgi:amino acid transporter